MCGQTEIKVVWNEKSRLSCLHAEVDAYSISRTTTANVWKAITELSLFFKSLTSTVITNEDMARLESDIPIILCKLERIFPSSFFDSMEHLPVHLPYEARIAGLVQFRWMYPFERLKPNL